MNCLQLINIGSETLKNKNIKSHHLDSEILLSKALGKKREKIITNLNQFIKSSEIKKFNNLVKRRSLKEPIAYILKEKEFWSKSFEVNKNTLIPRPETELLVEKIVNIYRGKPINILDIGTGSGCILISLISELKKSRGIGIDIAKKALFIAKKNSTKHNFENNIKFYKRCFSNLHHQKFDLIVSNPPYIRSNEINKLEEDIRLFEPKIALNGGKDGLDVIKKVIYKSQEILKINGVLALEIGSGQFKEVSKILKSNSFKIEYKIKDYKENVRSLISRLVR